MGEKLDFWKIPLAKLPLRFLQTMQKTLTDPTEAQHLHEHIAARLAAGERPRTAKEIALAERNRQSKRQALKNLERRGR